MSQDLVLQVRDLNVWYRPSGTIGRRKRRQVLHDVSFDLHRGEILGLVGESGSGKTTLARTILGFVPDYTGTVTHFTKRPQMVFQDPASSLNPSRTVGWILAEPLRIYGKYGKEEIARRVERTMELVGLDPECRDRLPHQLSGGQRQRVCIGAALIVHPQLIVADEAVSALDASVQAQVLNLLKEVQADFGLTYFFISHDLSVVGYMSDRVAVMYLGRIVEQADRNTLFGSAAHPYTKALLAAAPVHDPAKRHIRAFLPGELPSPFSPPAGCAFHPRCPQVMPRCREEAPELREIAPDHLARCHLYG